MPQTREARATLPFQFHIDRAYRGIGVQLEDNPAGEDIKIGEMGVWPVQMDSSCHGGEDGGEGGAGDLGVSTGQSVRCYPWKHGDRMRRDQRKETSAASVLIGWFEGRARMKKAVSAQAKHSED